jgi:hypothetical protein
MTTNANAPLSGETPNGTSPQGETPTTPGNGETPGTTTLSPADLQKEIERLTASLKRANKEAKDEREAANDLRKFKEQIESQQMTEKDRLEKQLADLQKAHEDYRISTQQRLVTQELRVQASDLGFADLSDALRLIDYAELDYDEDGVPTNARKLLEKLAKDKSYLLSATLAQQARSQSPGNSPNPRPSGQTPDGARDEYEKRMYASGKYPRA